jgi:hypothetical protein
VFRLALLSKLTGALSPPVLLCSVFLFALAFYLSRRAQARVATAIFSLVVATVFFSVLVVTPRPLPDQPFPDAQEVADATRQLVSGNGYVTYVHENVRHPPRYSPGFSLVLAPFAATGDDYPSNVQRGATFYAALYVLAAVIAAWSLKGPAAGALAALSVGISPFAKAEASLIMSDGFAAGVTVFFLALLLHPTPRRITWVGLLAGALVGVRLPMVLNLVALLMVLPWALRKRLLLSSAPPLAALGLFQWLTFGSPLKTGYNYWLPGIKNFSFSFALASPISGDGPWVVGDALHGLALRWLCPCPIGGPMAALSNLAFYPSVLLGLFWVFVPPPLLILGMMRLRQSRHELTARFTGWLTGLSFIFFVFYFYQGARFMAAPATLLGVFGVVKVVDWMERRYPSPR